MRKRELDKIKVKLINFSVLFLVSLILLVTDIMLAYVNGAYYGTWVEKYISFLVDDTIWLRRRMISLNLFIPATICEIYSLYEYVHIKIKNSKKGNIKKQKKSLKN